MEEMPRAWLGKVVELPYPLQAHHSPQISMCSPTQKFFKPFLSDVLRRHQYLGMID